MSEQEQRQLLLEIRNSQREAAAQHSKRLERIEKRLGLLGQRAEIERLAAQEKSAQHLRAQTIKKSLDEDAQ